MRMTLLTIALSAALAGCASRDPKPDDMSAAAHRAEAERERQAAHADLARASASEREGRPASAPAFTDPRTPWKEPHPEVEKREHSPALESAAAHARHAAAHERAAAELEGFEEADCRGIPAETRAACPLLNDVVEIDDVYGGARVVFAANVSVRETVARIRCHLAFARTRAYADVEDCPLYVRGVEVAAAGPHALTLTCRDETDRELTRRIRQLARAEALPGTGSK